MPAEAEREPAADAAEPPTIAPTSRRDHRTLVTVLLVVAVLTGLPAMLAVWVERQALDTGNWTETSAELLADADVQAALGAFLVDEVFRSVDVAGELERALPAQLAGLASPAAAGLRQVADREAPQLLARPRVQQAWRRANELAHRQLVRVIRGGGPVVATGGGDVTLDVRALVDEVAGTLGVEDQVVAARRQLQSPAGSAARGAAEQRLGVTLPASFGRITIMRSDELEAVQAVAKAIHGLAIVLTAVSLALFAAAVALAGGWRRVALRTVGWCFVGMGVVVLLARRVGGDRLVDALVPAESVRAAAHAAWTIGTGLLYDVAAAMLVYGLLLVAAAWLAGSTRPAVETRRALAPTLRDRPAAAFGVVAIAFLLVLLWGPTPVTRAPLGIAALAVLLALGVETLRRLAGREFPDARRGDTVRRVRAWLDERRRVGRREAGSEGTRTPIEELERLAALRDRGALDDEEFRAQKQLLLHGS
ncbi:SHOCT domain-containing protein [Conexibacter arvalis]|uniref:Cytochrome b561 n=1 Tax=Conexibacter arvalis TaxID=912552 RepID=A0A840IKX0_9ACTN|nr:SHOCT domain-containing protein [Conexibacter arvalis]MBB4664783.1 cytochrome b561 [Conexibacter arvalis]